MIVGILSKFKLVDNFHYIQFKNLMMHLLNELCVS